MTDLNLLDDHRKAWQHLVGQKKRFRATIGRFGHKHRQGAKINKGATLLLLDVHQFASPYKIDHVWIDYNVQLAKFGELVRPNGEIEFEAVVDSYIKGGKNIYGKGCGTFDDLKLVRCCNFKLLKVPYLPKSYTENALQNENLINYAIGTKQNIKSGVKLGVDPRFRLGEIKVGQGFANRLAKTLSWKWSNKLPKKYQYQKSKMRK